jgi:superfamily II DNA or RNA helicase
MVNRSGPPSGFARAAAAVRLFGEDGSPLLRTPQHGSALAVAAHFTGRKEPAAVALPTGVGKTAVMTLLPYLLSSRRVLVIVPTRLLREQIADEFSSLTVLRHQAVIPTPVWSPKTTTIKHRTEGDDWAKVLEYEVVVTAPNSIVTADYECTVPEHAFDLVLVDEAHHSPAPIWKAVTEKLSSAKQVYFTATPYRRDELTIQATIAYEFSLSEAVAQGYVAPVDLKIVDDRGDVDAALIEEVVALTKMESSPYFDTPFLARTSSKDHARELSLKYEAAGLKARVILGEDSLKRAREHIADVRVGAADGLIMVGVLGEGFDFPAIKVAAYHRAHKSLPATLQFIGRVSRVHSSGPERALVLAPKTEGASETQALYRNDAQWSSLIPELADHLFQREAKRALIDRALITPIQGLVSPSNLRPKRIVDIYDVGGAFAMDLEDELDEDPAVVQWWQTESRQFLVVIRKHDAPPKWLYSDVLVATEFELQCAIYARDEGLLFLSTNGDSERLALLLGLTAPIPVHPERLYAMLNAQGVQAYFNVGLRSVDVPTAKRAAYMMNSGPSVGDTIRPDDSATYTLGHAVAKITENGRTRSFGIAIRKSRVWMPQSGPLADFHEWCMSLARLLHRVEPAGMVDGLQLRPEKPFERFPEVAIAATPGTRLIELGTTFTWQDGYEAHIVDLENEAHVSPDRLSCEVTARADADHSFVVCYGVNGSATLLPDQVVMKRGDEEVDATAELQADPYVLFFGDGSSVRSFLISSPAPNIAAFPPNNIEIVDWSGVDISRETEPCGPDKVSIFSYLHRELARRYPDATIINDDRANELADIIVISDRGAHVEVTLYHCKGAARQTERVDQLYVVAGQALRSLRWALNRSNFWRDVLKRRKTRKAFKIIQNGADPDGLFARAAHTAPETRFQVCVVQPGLKRSALRQGTAANVLLSSCKNSADSAGVQFLVFCGGSEASE